MKKIDVSIVLNMHREALFLVPTLRSLEQSAYEAKNAGITVELIAVFDRSDASTRDVFRSYDLSVFSRIEIVEVDVGSLGLARNAGIAHAHGEFVWTSDADDLVSSNAIVELLATAKRHPHAKVAVFLEYLCAFGEQYHNVRYVGSEYLTAADFAFQHPYVSRIFVHRAVFDTIRYDDLRVTSGFAYEDWHFNCELRALGYDMAVATDTVLFYRQRPGSLLRQANAASARLIPHSRLFDVAAFTYEMEQSRERVGDWGEFMRVRREIFDDNNTERFMRSEKLQGILREVLRLEPEIEPGRVETAGSYSPVPWSPRHWGLQLENFYRMLGDSRFSDVVLLPWLNPGGAEKYILQILAEIADKQHDAKFLVIAGEPSARHDWIDRLPKGSVFIDVYNAFPTLDNTERDAMLIRAMLAASEDGARLHVKSSAFAHRLLDAYGPVLFAKYRPVYYRFSDGTYRWRDAMLRGPWGINVMRRHLHGMWKVLCDCKAIAQADLELLGTLQSKYETVYAKCSGHAKWELGSKPSYRLLWASRIAPEKRPELVRKIAEALCAVGLNVVIDAYGTPEEGVDARALVQATAGVEYRGSFSSFSELPVESYDAFLYTSAFDGLPNVLLEALSAGLPVIAPDVGGIREAVMPGRTGWLVEAEDDNALVGEYVRAIAALYKDWPAARTMSQNAQRLILERHGENAFSGRVGDVLGLHDVRVGLVA